jgi:hypothetical protein
MTRTKYSVLKKKMKKNECVDGLRPQSYKVLEIWLLWN